MPGFSLTVDGSKLVKKNILTKADLKSKHMLPALVQEGEELLTEVDRIIPRVTGTLALSRFLDTESRGFNSHVDVGYSAPYASAVHDGYITRAGNKVEGRPFLRKTWARRSRTAARRIAATIKRRSE